jgi:beta-lactamase regulating signal transducer with metallopeptidase domain
MTLSSLAPLYAFGTAFTAATIVLGFAAAGIAWITLKMSSGASSRLRSLFLFSALVIVVAGSFATGVNAARSASHAGLASATGERLDRMTPIASHYHASGQSTNSLTIYVSNAETGTWATIPMWLGAVITLAWAISVVWLLLRLVLSYRSATQLVANAEPLIADASEQQLIGGLRRRMRVLSTDECNTPMSIGVFTSAILLPASLLERINSSDQEEIVLHEAAHLTFCDDWLLLLQTGLQAFTWFSPGAHWIAAKLSLERECAADEWVADRRSRLGYAQCLGRIAECVSGTAPRSALAATLKTTDMVARIKRLVSPIQPRPIRSFVALAAAVVAFAALAQLPINRYIALADTRASSSVDQSYVNGLNQLGYGNLTSSDMQILNLSGVPLSYVRAISNTGVRPTTNEFVTLYKLGVTPEYVTSMRGRLHTASVKDLTLLYAARVTALYMDEIGRYRPDSLVADTLLRFKMLDVTPQYLAMLKTFGYGSVPTEQVLLLKLAHADEAMLQKATAGNTRHPSPVTIAQGKY